jgi:UDP-N-acetylmuramate--alanine ligase
MALGMALIAGAPVECLPKALSSFKGVDRRFSYKIRRDDLVLIDDYAHHPTELDALFQAVSEMYPNDRKCIVFQPHLFSRTRDFATGFAKSLAKFDQVFLLDIYPAREEPIPGISASWLEDKIRIHKKDLGKPADLVSVIEKSAIEQRLKKSNCRIQLLVGAGDIGDEVTRITKMYTDEN